jgi:hypothetical protein
MSIEARVAHQVYWMCGGGCARCRVRLSPRRGLPTSFEIDHVRPRSWGGGDHISNLQPLCQRCNASKSNRSAADFRPAAVRERWCPRPLVRPVRPVEVRSAQALGDERKMLKFREELRERLTETPEEGKARLLAAVRALP